METKRETKITGHVKWYNEAKGFGFISRGDGKPDVFVTRDALIAGLGTLKEGAPVIFNVMNKYGLGEYAGNVRLEKKRRNNKNKQPG